MLGRIVRMILRIAGWLLTPLVVTLAAAAAATLAFQVIGPGSRPAVVLGFGLGAGLLGALLGALGWVQLLRRSPELREGLAVTASGLPQPGAVREMLQSVALEEKPPT